MNTHDYCRAVENADQQHKQLFSTILIRESNSRLVSLEKAGYNLIFEPSIKKDYRYMVREEIIEKIGRISQSLRKDNKVLIIRSVWRSFEHQRLLWEDKVASLQKEYPNKRPEEIREIVSHYIADESKSMHSTGGAVDALIFDLGSDRVIDFGTNNGFKIDLNEKCYPYHPGISPQAIRNRKLLIGLFENEDFTVDLKEYWHFDYGNISWAIRKGKKHAIYGIVNE
jgi:D-alanyl-D-alanine dipeptidase